MPRSKVPSADRASLEKVWSTAQENLRALDGTLLRLRGLAIAYAATIIGVAKSLSWDQPYPGGPFLLLAAIPWGLFYVLDRNYYRRRQLSETERSRFIERRLFDATLASEFSTLEDELTKKLRWLPVATSGAFISAFYAFPLMIVIGLGTAFYAILYGYAPQAVLWGASSASLIGIVTMVFEVNQAGRLEEFRRERAAKGTIRGN